MIDRLDTLLARFAENGAYTAYMTLRLESKEVHGMS